MKKPFFSIIIPTWNRAHTIERAIQSVLDQSFSDFECLIIDDGSADHTQQIIARFQDDRIFYFFQENKGVSAARNEGLHKTKADWICLLDSDDYWDTKKLEKQYEFIRNNPQYLIHQTEEIWIRNGKRVNTGKIHTKETGNIFKKSLSMCAISPSSVCLHKSLFETYGLFDEDLPACEDYDLWLRITAEKPVGLLKEKLLIKTGGHADQLSQAHPAMDRFRIYSMLKMLQLDNLSDEKQEDLKEMLLFKLEVFIQGAEKRGKSLEDLNRLIRSGLEKPKELASQWPVIKKNLLDFQEGF